ncbi:MAG: transposase [Dehalobacter sp.]|nr:transposase [Dehalobacter sp.]
MARGKWDDVKACFHEIEKWLKQGLVEYQIFKNLGIGKTTWEAYKKKHPELIELLKKGREIQISEVENALFKNATGYYYYVDEAIKVKDPDGGEHVEKVRLQKFKPPETGAIAFFLKNKNKRDWADNPQMIDLKKEELEIRKAESEFKAW